jgi:hypothetical protein
MTKYSKIQRVTNMRTADLIAQAAHLGEEKQNNLEEFLHIKSSDTKHLRQKKTKINILGSRMHRNYSEVIKRSAQERATELAAERGQ